MTSLSDNTCDPTALCHSLNRIRRLISVPVKTLKNWQQNRTRSAGTARALVKFVQAGPRAAIKALHASLETAGVHNTF